MNEAPLRPSGTRPVALTIAGSDSGGGAGIQADLKTFEAFGVFGTTAITAVTAQNTLGVRDALPLPPELVVAQIEAVEEDLRPSAVKTGMLANPGIVRAVARVLRERHLGPLVVDPVMVATSGDPLLDEEGIDALRGELLSAATLATPNAPEAELLTGVAIRERDDLCEAARRLVAAGAGAALVKGGHLEGPIVIDVLWDGERERVFEGPRVAGTNTHGTGCTLSAAVTAGLALGRPLVEAVRDAIDYTRRAIGAAPGLGRGAGPLNHRPG